MKRPPRRGLAHFFRVWATTWTLLAACTSTAGCACDDESSTPNVPERDASSSNAVDASTREGPQPSTDEGTRNADASVAASDAGLPREALTDDTSQQPEGSAHDDASEGGPPVDDRESDGAVDDTNTDESGTEGGAATDDASSQVARSLPQCAWLPPALAYDQVALVDTEGLWLTPLHGESLDPALTWTTEFIPNRPVADPAAPGFVVSGADGETCSVRAVDDAGQTRWAVEISARECEAAVPTEHGWLLASTTLDASGELRLLAFADGTELDRAELATRPTATPARAQSGGSHWVIGAEDHIALVQTGEGALAVLGGASVELPAVEQIATLPPSAEQLTAGAPDGSETLLVAAGSDALARYQLDLESGTLALLGNVIITPDAIRAPLVATEECGDRSGGSHWWCDGGVLATGGDGWLAAWKLSDGALWFAHSLEENVTSLALTGDGVLTSGGSHWLPGRDDSPSEGSWRLRAVSDPAAEPTLTLDEKVSLETCVAGPVLDTEGSSGVQLVTIQSSELVRVATRASGFATGFSRAGGNNAGSAMFSDDQANCREGSQRLYERFISPAGGVTLSTLVSLDTSPSPTLETASLVLGGRHTSAWLAGLGRAGRVLWEWQAPPDALEPSFDVLLGMGDRILAAAVLSGESAPLVGTWVVSAEGTTLSQASIEVTNLSDVVAAIAGEGQRHLVGNLQSAAAEDADVWIAEVNAAGAPLSVVNYTHPASRQALGAVVIPGSSDILIFGGDELAPGATSWVARVSSAGEELWSHEQTLASPSLFAVDAHVEADGSVLVAVVNGSGGLLNRYDPNGVLSSSTPLSGVRPVALANDALGLLGLLAEDASLYRIDAGAVHLTERLPVDVGIDAEASRGVALAAAPEFGWVLGANIAELDGSSSAFIARTDQLGRCGCAEAGRCATDAAPSCTGLSECSIERCDASRGQCESRDVLDGTRCGPTDICTAGSCGPAPELLFPQTIDANDCFGVQSYAECVPGSLSYASLVLNDDGTLISLEPAATGTWTQPNGDGSLEMFIEGAQGGDEWIEFSGALVEALCYEGTIQTSEGIDGAFRACKN